MSNVTSIGYMFSGNTAFNQDISAWNTSNVTDTIATFEGASSFNQDISSWNTSKVRAVASMFEDATSFNQDISDWDVSSVREGSWRADFLTNSPIEDQPEKSPFAPAVTAVEP